MMNKPLKVFVYYNLHKHCWSVKALNGPDKGRVIQHTNLVYLTNVEFKVYEAGRQRVLKEKRKNVHAGVVGFLQDTPTVRMIYDLIQPDVEYTYNPYTTESFILTKDRSKVLNAKAVIMDAANKKGRVYGAEQ